MLKLNTKKEAKELLDLLNKYYNNSCGDISGFMPLYNQVVNAIESNCYPVDVDEYEYSEDGCRIITGWTKD